MLILLYIFAIFMALIAFKRFQRRQSITGSRKKSFGEKIGRVCVGAVLVTLIGLLFAGDMFFLLVFYSVICTAGTAVILWIALCYGIGSLAYSLFNRISGNEHTLVTSQVVSDQSSVVIKPLTVFTREQISLANYVRDARAAGMADQDIRNKLSEIGWQASDIDAGYSLVGL